MSKAVNSQFNLVEWNINNKSTSIAGKIFIALAVITLVGGICTIAAHGGIGTIGSDALIFGGGAAVVAGLIYGGLEIRDWREKKQAEIAWNNLEKSNFESEMEKLSKEGMQLGQTISLTDKNGEEETYWLQAEKGKDNVQIFKQKPSV